ncbi:MAG: hypothetical protein LW875_11280 [Proteobacteria bacterium]|jgi:hypothetical protein|nr:hypothetical protein [Pseudomonadota bacterium]
MRKFLAAFSLILFLGCAPAGDAPRAGTDDNGAVSTDYSAYSSLSWEQTAPNARSWSLHVFEAIDRHGEDLIFGSEDVLSFCPLYYSLNRKERIEFWGFLFSVISKYESNHNPAARTLEENRRDAISGGPLYSEGLLMLSYQDQQIVPECQFDHQTDQRLAVTDLRRSILQPKNNLECGVRIMARQLKKYDRIVIGNGAHWGVIQSNSRVQKILEIISSTRKFSSCQ